MKKLALNPNRLYYRKVGYPGGLSLCLVGTHDYSYFSCRSSAKKWLQEKYKGRKIVESSDMFVVKECVIPEKKQ